MHMKTDLTQLYKNHYSASVTPGLVTIEAAQFISIRGQGDPSGPVFAESVQALYTSAYILKFMWKAKGRDFGIPRLEGLWSFDRDTYGSPGMAEAPQRVPREAWEFRLLLRLPLYVKAADVRLAAERAVEHKKCTAAARSGFYKTEEGLCVQALHKGPFSEEPATLLKIEAFMQEHALQHNGPHHEIYLSDFRRSSPEKYRTILRTPVKQIIKS